MLELLHARLGLLEILAPVVAVAMALLGWWIAVANRDGSLTQGLTPEQHSFWTDMGYLALSPVTEVISCAMTSAGITACAALAGDHIGVALLDGFGPVMQQPRWLILLEMLVIGDLFYYCGHRLAHQVPLLWRFHAVHHANKHLKATSALRAHPLECYVHVLHIVPLFLVGFPVDALIPLMPFVMLYAMFIHADKNIALRPVSYLINSPAFHRWHHALDISSGTKNYAGLFPIYDKLFGTYYLPAHAPAAIGIEHDDVPDTCAAQLLYPFQSRHSASAPAQAAQAAKNPPSTASGVPVT